MTFQNYSREALFEPSPLLDESIMSFSTWSILGVRREYKEMRLDFTFATQHILSIFS